jgi:hypothetical protein
MNNLITYLTPNWVALCFGIFIALPFLFILQFIFKISKQANKPIWFTASLLFFILYLTYIVIASKLNWFNIISFPPRVLLLTTFPYATFLFILFTKSSLFKFITTNAAVANLVSLHLFRVVGVFFIILAMYNALPKVFAYIAGAGDVLAAITSVFVARAITQKKSYANKLTLIWNIFGTIDIMFTAIAANVLTKLSINNGTMGVDKLAEFPFCIIPAFAPPTILFIHWLIFKKLHAIKILKSK